MLSPSTDVEHSLQVSITRTNYDDDESITLITMTKYYIVLHNVYKCSQNINLRSMNQTKCTSVAGSGYETNWRVSMILYSERNVCQLRGPGWKC